MPTFFRRCDLYRDTYLKRVRNNEVLKKKLRSFMELKRANPNQPFGSSDKPFISSGFFSAAVPGLRHAHLTFDLSIVYKVEGNIITLYGFFTHDELGTGQPPNLRRQKGVSQQLAGDTCR